MPRICYVEKRFGKRSLAVIAYAAKIIEDYDAQGLSLTLRQLYYRFVAADLIENSQASYKNLGSIVNDARLAGYLDWEAIEDRGRNLIRTPHWDSPADIVDTCAKQFAIDKWRGQQFRVEVWVEKQALEAVVGQAAEVWDCPYFACKGYTSQSEMWRAARRMQRYRDHGQLPIVLHLGDHDPSGIDMTRDIEDRITKLFGVPIVVHRVALNMDQIEEYDPPPNPAKMTDSRFSGYEQRFGDESWELDALEPATLNRMIQEKIQDYLDLELWEERVAEEQEGRRLLARISSRWDHVVQTLESKSRAPRYPRKRSLKGGGRNRP